MTSIADDNSKVGRPRDPSVERRVLEAARSELADNGVEGFSIRGVARRAGVSRPSLNLRWPDVDTLIVDALDDITELDEVNATGSLRGDLLALTDQIASVLGSPLIELQMRLVADALRRPDLLARFQQRVMRSAFERFHHAIDAAVRRGEVPTDLDVALLVDSLIGVMLLRTFSSPKRRPPARKARVALVDELLRMFAR